MLLLLLTFAQNVSFMEISLGKFNTLQVVKEVDFGMYLDGGIEGEILLPKRYVPRGCKPGDKLRVFLYLDQEERLTATTQTPLAQIDEFAYLEVAWVNQFGAFLKWGLMKDLFVPFREQKVPMEVGKKYIAHVHLDKESFRIMASTKVEHYLSHERPLYEPNEEVTILIWQRTNLGYKAIIDNSYAGLLYKNEVFTQLRTGMKTKAYIKHVREDGKIDLTLQRPGKEKIEDFASILLEHIRRSGGYTYLNDKSPADEIYALFGVSKKTFKKAIGDLYKKRLITFFEKGIKLT